MNKLEMLLELNKIMDNWLQKKCNSYEFEGWIGDELAENMANAAFAVLLANINLNNYLKREDLIKNEY